MGSFTINECGEVEFSRKPQNGGRKAGASAPKPANWAEALRDKRRAANAARKTAVETQEYLKWALQNCRNQGDLDAIRDLVMSYGTTKQRKLFEKLEYDFTHVSANKKAAIGNVVSSLRQNAEARENTPAVVQEAPQAPAEGSKKARRAEIAKQRELKLADKENFRQAMLNAESVEDLNALEKEYGKKFTGDLKRTYNARMNVLEKAAAEQAVQHAEMQSVYDRLFGYGNGKHPSNTPLGTAKPTPSSGMTWAEYNKQRGISYTKPFSEVGLADELAREAIARNAQHAEMQSVYEGLFGEKPPIAEPPGGTGVPNPAGGTGVPNPAGGTRVPNPAGGTGGTNPPVGNGGKAAGKGKGFKMPEIGKKGKFALAALALGALSAGIAYLTKSKKATPTTPSGEPIKQGFVMPDSVEKEKVDTMPAAPIVNPVDTIEQQVVRAIPRDAESGKYIVKKGDNCWNIANAELIKEKGGEIPSDTEILKRTYQIIKRNDLHFEEDKYTVLIYENDTLNINM